MTRPGELVWTPERLAIARAVYAEKGSHAAAARVLTSLGHPTNRDAVEGAFRRHGKSVMSERPTLEGPPSTERSRRASSLPEVDFDDTPEPSAVPAPRKLRKAIVGHDLHAPLTSPVWQDLFEQVAVGAGVDTVFLNGDVVDAEALGSYGSRPGITAKFSDEIAATNVLLDRLDALGIANRWILWGNHDQQRMRRYIADKAPAFDGLISLEGLLRLEERGWKVVDYKDHVYFGSCLLSHELGRGGRTAAARTKEDVHGDVAIGHVHRCSVEWRGDVMGKVFFGASFGWGADVAAAHYAHKAHVAATHVLGFGLLTLDEETGQTFCEAVPIVNGRCVAHGRLYVSKVACPKVTRKVA